MQLRSTKWGTVEHKMSRRRAQNGARWSTKWSVVELRVKCRSPKFLGNLPLDGWIRTNKWLFASVERNIQVVFRHIFRSTKFNAKRVKSQNSWFVSILCVSILWYEIHFFFYTFCAFRISFYFCKRPSQSLGTGQVKTSMESGGRTIPFVRACQKEKDVFGRYYL